MNKKIKVYIKKIIPKRLLQKRRSYIRNHLYKDSLNNYIKGIDCVNKRVTSKIRIVFIISFPETWNSLYSIYSEIINRNDIEVKILAVPKNSRGNDDIYIANQKNDAYVFLSKIGVSAINAYCYEEKAWYDLENYQPDYVFYTRPYNGEYPSVYRSNETCKYSKICFVPYAYNMIDGDIFNVTYNEHFILTAYRVFCPNISRYEKCRDYFGFKKEDEKEKFQYFGYPRFDLLTSNETNTIIKEDYKKNIIWTPRWIPRNGIDNKKSFFIDYHNKILEFAEKNNNVNLIIRPHPLMFSTLIEMGLMSEEEINKYKKRCKELGNVFFDSDKDYRKIMEVADIIISDYSSLLVEFLIAGNKVIYCDDDKFLNKEGKVVTSALYHAKSFDDIEYWIEKLLLDEDPMMDTRKDAKNKLIPYSNGEIGKHIIEYLIKDLHANKLY